MPRLRLASSHSKPMDEESSNCGTISVVLNHVSRTGFLWPSAKAIMVDNTVHQLLAGRDRVEGIGVRRVRTLCDVAEAQQASNMFWTPSQTLSQQSSTHFWKNESNSSSKKDRPSRALRGDEFLQEKLGLESFIRNDTSSSSALRHHRAVTVVAPLKPPNLRQKTRRPSQG